jgi:hypothetical protein
MINPISLANTFGHLVTAASGLITLMNNLTNGSVFVANTQLQVTGAGTSLIVNNSISVGNTIHVNGSLNLISNSIKTNGGSATITLPIVTDTLIGANNTVTLTNKTLTSPNINSPVITTNAGTASITLPTTSQTLVGRTSTDTLTNKTLTAPTITSPVITGTAQFNGPVSIFGSSLIVNQGINTVQLPQANTELVTSNTNQAISNKQFEFCSLTNSLVIGAPSSANSAINRQYLDDSIAAALAAQFTTGDVKLTLKTTADTGWVVMNDGSIGSAASGATTRANADTQALFTLIYNNTVDTDAPVSGSRSGNATTDFNAGKRLTLPKALGRALACYGTGSGLNAKRLGEILGVEDTVIGSHTHTASQTAHSHTYSVTTGGPGGFTDTVSAGAVPGGGGGGPTATATPAITVNSTGVSVTGKNWAPTLFLNVHLKL